MRAPIRASLLAFLTTCALSAAYVPQPARALNTLRRPFYEAAKQAFYQLSPADQLRLHVLLIATGDFNAMVSNTFGGRLYDAIVGFEQSHGLRQDGTPTREMYGRLERVAGPIVQSWGITIVNHPWADASLVIPSRFGLVSNRTRRGLAFENETHTMSVDFAYFAADDVPMPEIFARLATPGPGRRIDMRVIHPDFFAVAGGGDQQGTYSRYIAVPGGSVGFTFTWNTNAFPAGNRISVLMANGLFPSRNTAEATVANNPQPQEAPPPQTASLEAPKVAPSLVTVSGSAFFVSADGDLVTNNHVIKGCDGATVVGRGSAKIVAKDARNDLALLHLTVKPEAGSIKPLAFRSTPIQLGETAYALGFPYAGALDNGVNFTNGMISSVAGMNNDSTNFQMTAPVQPGNSGGPVLDQSGNLLGVVVARMSDVAAMNATNTVPQNVNFGIKSEVTTSFLRINGVTPLSAADGPALPTTQVAALGKADTVQVTCVRSADGD